MLICLLALVIFPIVVHILLNCNERARLIKKMPGPKHAFIFGNALEILRSPEQLFQFGRDLAKKCRGIYGFWAFPLGCVNIYNPGDIETVISSIKFSDKSLTYDLLKPWLRNGLLLSNGQKWHNRRKILTPAFHFNILREFCVVIEDNSQRLIDKLRQTRGESVDVIPLISEYTLQSICETAMGTRLVDTKDSGKSYKEAIYALGHVVLERFKKLHLMFDFIFNLTSLAKVQKRHLVTLHSFTGTIIEERKEHFNKHGANIFEVGDDDGTFMVGRKKKIAMLDLLLLAEKDGFVDREGIQEEVDTFMFEGHDTTASGLIYCLLLLANHKNVQDKIVAELNEVFENSDRRVTMEDLSKLRYLDCVIKESLRLYPPVPLISRKLSETVELSGYMIPADTICHIHVFDLHRSEDLFENALKFDPDRFLPENSVGRHPYAYIPFSAGPRNCIGQRFAMLEMKSCISRILRNFELKAVTRESDIAFISDIVLRNNAPVCLKFIPRS